MRLGLVTGAGEDALPYSAHYVADFEQRYCYDRYWTEGGDGSDGRNTRYLCCGHGLSVVGDANWPFFTNTDTGVLAQFRHQHFLLFMIAHFQKAALLMVSDQLVHALERLEVGNPDSVKRFKRAIRQRFEIFLRFTHRYWFHDISEQAAPKALFKMCADHLGLDPLYARSEGTHSRHGRVSRQRQPAASGEYRGQADRRHHLRPDRHGHHRLPRHEPDRRGRRPSRRSA